MIFLLLWGIFTSGAASASDRILDFSPGCRVFMLEANTWKEVDGAIFNGIGLSNSQIIKDEKFTVFRKEQGIFGVHQKCVRTGDAEPTVTEPVEASPQIGRSPWSAVFSMGMNLSPSATQTSIIGGASSSQSKKYNSSFAFIGGADYRVSSGFHLGGEIGLSQLTESTSSGNETSFVVFSPTLVFPLDSKIEFYLGPNLGFFILSQNAELITDATRTISVPQQSASAVLMGGQLGMNYSLSRQFDLGLFFRYFKPGDLKITGTQTSPTTDSFEASVSTSYLMMAGSFTIHF